MIVNYVAHFTTATKTPVGMDLVLTGEWIAVYDKAQAIGKILGFDLDYIEIQGETP